MESPRSHYSPHRQHSNYTALPSISSLTNGLPPSTQSPTIRPQSDQPPRDSGAWIPSQSKHTSANSGLHVSTLLNHEEPSVRNSIPSTPTSSRLSQQQGLPSFGHPRDSYSTRDSYASHNTRLSTDQHGTHDSRRSSMNSQVQSGMSGMALSPSGTSPYESHRSSQLSQNSHTASQRRSDGHTTHLSPIQSRTPRHIEAERTRVAPPIVPNPRQYGAPDPTASKPTQGFPWAFPDSADGSGDRIKRRASSSESSDDHKISRQGSYAASSVRSSVLSADQALPAGQRRFEDGMGFQKIIGPVTSRDLQSPPISDGGHSQSMQHRSVTQLQNEHGALLGSGGYSRTPELRVSHKLAERKRRSEMKDLFEELNKLIPSNGAAKASKWEILSKAGDYIRTSRDEHRALLEEIQRLRADVDFARSLQKDNEAMRAEMHAMQERMRHLDTGNSGSQGYGSSHHHPSQNSNGMTNGHGHHASTSAGQASASQSSHYGSGPHSAPMQGVEYALPTRPSYEHR